MSETSTCYTLINLKTIVCWVSPPCWYKTNYKSNNTAQCFFRPGKISRVYFYHLVLLRSAIALLNLSPSNKLNNSLYKFTKPLLYIYCRVFTTKLRYTYEGL